MPKDPVVTYVTDDGSIIHSKVYNPLLTTGSVVSILDEDTGDAYTYDIKRIDMSSGRHTIHLCNKRRYEPDGASN